MPNVAESKRTPNTDRQTNHRGRRIAAAGGGLALTALALTGCAAGFGGNTSGGTMPVGGSGMAPDGPIKVSVKCGRGGDNEFANQVFNAPVATPTTRNTPPVGTGNVGDFYKLWDTGDGNSDGTRFALLKVMSIGPDGNETFALLDGEITTTDGTKLQGSTPGAEDNLPAADTSVELSAKRGDELGVVGDPDDRVYVFAGAGSSSEATNASAISEAGLALYCNQQTKASR